MQLIFRQWNLNSKKGICLEFEFQNGSRGTRAVEKQSKNKKERTAGAGAAKYMCGSPRHGARGEHAMASEERKMAFAEHARKGGAGLRFFLRSTETYRPRRKNIMNSIFRQNVFAKNNVLQITYISPRMPQRCVIFVFSLFLHSACTRSGIQILVKFLLANSNSILGICVACPEPM